MAYYLGIDIGTTFSAAAVWRDGQVTVASLGERAPVIPSVLFIAEDGALLVGEAAERRAPSDPRRTTREFKRRVGDPTPIIVGGTPYSADALMSKLLRWVVDKVVAREGGPPDGVAVSYPANWGAFKQDLLAQEIRLADLDPAEVATLTEPAAAAVYYASQERVADGAVVAVYDLGGGTFDVAILRKVANGWEILGEPEGIERLGGIDFDEAVFQHVTATLGDEYEALDPEDDATLAALVRLRRECVEAKEALSEDTDVSIPVLLPGIQRDVRLTRVEFEEMIRPALTGSIEATKRALRTAKVATEDVTAVLLVGGSSRVPLVGQLVGAELGRPVAIDVHPKYGIALGAAILAAERASDTGPLTSQITAIPPDVPLGPPPVVDGAGAAAGLAAAAGDAGAVGAAGAAAVGAAGVAAAAAAGDAGSLGTPGASLGAAAADAVPGAAKTPVGGEPGPAAGGPGGQAKAPVGAGKEPVGAGKESVGADEAFDPAADGPPVGDGPEVPMEQTAPTAPSEPIEPGPAAPAADVPDTQPEAAVPSSPTPEPPRTVRIPAPVVDEPVTEPIVSRTAEQPVVPSRTVRDGNGRGNGTGSGGRRRPPAPSGGGRGRMVLLAAVAATVVALAGVLFKLNGDGTDAETGGTTTVVTNQETTSTAPPETTTTTEPETTTTEATTTTTAPPLVTVPDVTGETPDDAASLLEDAGLVFDGTVDEPSDEIDAGLVIRADPAAGTELDPGSPVVLVVSSGPDNVAVPDVTGRDEASATAELEAAGLDADRTTAPVDDPAQAGIVVDQTPSGGNAVPAGTVVTLTVGELAAVSAPSA